MRVGPIRSKSLSESPFGRRRRLHVVPPSPPPPEPVHPDERRLRDAGGPDDRAVFTCGCGYLFEARVTASVGCPRCGEHQAW